MTSSYYTSMTPQELVQHTEYAGSETVQLLTRHLIESLDQTEKANALVNHFGANDLDDLRDWITELEDWKRDVINIMDEFAIDTDTDLKQHLSHSKAINSVLWNQGIEDSESLNTVLHQHNEFLDTCKQLLENNVG